jgi:hypothetical protein
MSTYKFDTARSKLVNKHTELMVTNTDMPGCKFGRTTFQLTLDEVRALCDTLRKVLAEAPGRE